MRKLPFWAATLLAAVVACTEAPFTPSESGEATAGPALSPDHTGRHTVVVNPEANGNGVAATIQEGIEMVESGGTVKIKPGTYAGPIFVIKGVTLEPLEPNGDPVIVETPLTSLEGIEVETGEPVIIRGLHLRALGPRGIFSGGPANLTVEGVEVEGPSVVGIGVWNNDPENPGPSRFVVRDSRVVMKDLPTGTYGIFAGGDLHSLIERNHVESPGAMCIEIRTRSDGGGSLSGMIRGNFVDRCGIGGGIRVDRDPNLAAGNPPFTGTGSVEILDNVVRNSTGICSKAGIFMEVLGGRIEGNDVSGYLQACATPGARSFPAGIWVGSRLSMPGATPTIRGNDVGGNLQAGIRLGTTVTSVLDATCNWWGAADGPSGLAGGSGTALRVEGAAPVPTYFPFATAPIAGTGATGC